jgi:hypothetical protein
MHRARADEVRMRVKELESELQRPRDEPDGVGRYTRLCAGHRVRLSPTVGRAFVDHLQVDIGELEAMVDRHAPTVGDYGLDFTDTGHFVIVDREKADSPQAVTARSAVNA